MCCKLPSIAELNKPRFEWCAHCKPKAGCTIYDSRPQACRNFICVWLINPALDEQWKPSRSKIMLVNEAESNRVLAFIDPSRPDAWKREPFYSTLKGWSQRALEHRGQVVVSEGSDVTVVLPHKDVRLGKIGPDQLIITYERQTPNGLEWDVKVLDRDHPDAAHITGHAPNAAS